MSFDDELCRICLSKDNLTDLLSPENAQIHENLQSLVFIDEENFYQQISKYICDNCQKSLQHFVEFKSRVEERYLEFHTLQTTEEYLEDVEEEEEEVEEDNVPVEDDEEEEEENLKLPKKYSCILCDKEIPDFRQYIEHKKTHLNCTMCSRTFITSRKCFLHFRAVHIKTNKTVLLPCDLCEKLFNGITALKIHKISHSDERPFSCDECDYKSKTKSRLNLHKISKHLSPEEKLQQQPVKKKYCCSYCGKICSSKTTLTQHTMIHTDEYSFECSSCRKQFRNKSAYTKHLLIHTGAKPHKCDVCERSFRLLDFLKKHKRTHGAEKKYVCTICGMSTAYKDSLTMHTKSVHMNIKNYVCLCCGEKFLKPSILKRHMLKKHPDVEPGSDQLK